MQMFKPLAAALLLALATTSTCMAKAKQATLREEAEAACYNDVMKLCNDDVPDEVKIEACMKKKRGQLSPECGRVFDTGLKKK